MSIYVRFPVESDYNFRLPATSRAAADAKALNDFKPYVDSVEHAPGYVQKWDQSTIKTGGVYAIDVVAGSLYQFSNSAYYAPTLTIYDADGFIIESSTGNSKYSVNSINTGFLAQETGRIYVGATAQQSVSFTNASLTVLVDYDAHGTPGNDAVLIDTFDGYRAGYLGGDGNDVIKSTYKWSATLLGGGGNDVIIISPQLETVDGGTGIDTIEYTSSDKYYYATPQDRTSSSAPADWGSFSVYGSPKFYGIEYVKISGTLYSIADLQAYKPFMTDTVNDDNLRGDNSANDILADLGNDQLNGFKGNDKLSAGRGNDFLFGGQGDDVLLGGEGQDTGLYENKASDFTIMVGRNDYYVIDKKGDAGTDLLNSVERLAFTDRTIDMNYVKLAQSLYFSYFGRAADSGGLLNFAKQLDILKAPASANELTAAYTGNAGLRGLIDSFGTSDESKAMYGGDTTAFVKAIYNNVLGRSPDQGGLEFWSKAIDAGTLTRPNASLAIMAGAQTNTTAEGQIDAALVANRVSAATNFTFALETASKSGIYAGDAAAALVKTMLSSVTANTDVMAFQSKVDAVIVAMSSLPVKAAEPVFAPESVDQAPLMLVGLPEAPFGM